MVSIDDNLICSVYEDNKINIYNCHVANNKVIFELEKSYTVDRVSCLTMECENSKIWLAVCSNLNLKLYVCEDEEWDDTYRILYHNESKLNRVLFQESSDDELLVISKDDSNSIKIYDIDNDEYRLNVIKTMKYDENNLELRLLLE